MNNSIWIGFDPREAAAFAVAKYTIKKHLTQPVPIRGLVLDDLQKRGIYYRPTELRPAAADRPILWDVISDAPMSTEHANARFLVPHLAKTGWALFMDADMLVRDNLVRVFERLDPAKAVYCVKHNHVPSEKIKMDGQQQALYLRKNWSSFVAFNCDHEANRSLTVDLINTVPGRDLHRFCWLDDEEIGELEQEWNFLVGYTSPSVVPKVVHFTSGTPDMIGYENCAYADEWRSAMTQWARGGR